MIDSATKFPFAGTERIKLETLTKKRSHLTADNSDPSTFFFQRSFDALKKMSFVCCFTLLTLAVLFDAACGLRPCYPLLIRSDAGPLLGIGYTAPNNGTAAAATSRVYQSLLAKGARLSQISLTWASLEPAPGQFNFELVAELMVDVRAANMQLMFNLATIDTDRFSLPPDLVDPDDPLRLANGLRWVDPNVTSRYEAALVVVAPLVAYSNGFHFGIGNEVDAALGAVEESVANDYALFVSAMRSFIQTLTTTQLSVGVTMTSSGLRAYGAINAGAPAWFTSLVTISDGVPVTYYPLEGNFSLEPLGAAFADVAETVSTLQRLNHCVLFQELGCPSGFLNASSVDGSSAVLQARFFNQSLQQLSAVAKSGAVEVAGVGVLGLVDWSPATCAEYAKYYRVTAPAFLEYLCTLGLMMYNGTTKPSLDVLMAFL
jgi:hypothetical protein